MCGRDGITLIKAEGCGGILSRRRLRGSLTVSVLAVITLGGETRGEQVTCKGCMDTPYGAQMD